MKQQFIERSRLKQAIENTYSDSKFYVSHAVESDGDFRKGLCLNRSSCITKQELQKILQTIDEQIFTTVSLFPNLLILNPQLTLSLSCVIHNQIFHTYAPEGYHHICEPNSHYDVYFLIDHESKKMTIMLGSKMKTIELRENTEFVWKYKNGTMHCQRSDLLKKTLLDPFWCSQAITVLRHVLRIKKTV